MQHLHRSCGAEKAKGVTSSRQLCLKGSDWGISGAPLQPCDAVMTGRAALGGTRLQREELAARLCSGRAAGSSQRDAAPRESRASPLCNTHTCTYTAHRRTHRHAQPHVITHSCTDSRPQPHTRTPTSTRHHPYTNPSHCYRQGLLPPHQAARSPIQPGWECLEQQPGQGNSTELCQGRLRLDIKEPLCTGGWWARSSSPGQWVQP